MAITVNDIVTRAWVVLHDATTVRWPFAELIQWVNDAQREVVLLVPDAGAKNVTMLTVAGTRQTIPADGWLLLDVIRNMGASGLSPGAVIRQVAREVLDTFSSEWHTAAQTSAALHYVFDPRDPQHFYLYPPSNGSYQINIVHSAAPTLVDSIEDAITVPDVYANALLDYVLYRAYSKDAEFTANLQRAAAHYQAFTTSLGFKNEAQARYNPANNSPFNPNVPQPRVVPG